MSNEAAIRRRRREDARLDARLEERELGGLLQLLRGFEPWGAMLAEDPTGLREVLHQDARILVLQRGELVCREGDYGNSAYIVLDGAARRADTLKVRGEDGDEIEEGYKRVIRAMQAVLARMVKVEGFTEIIERVRGIIDFQGSVKKDTERKYRKVMEEIFGKDPPKKDDDENK